MKPRFLITLGFLLGGTSALAQSPGELESGVPIRALYRLESTSNSRTVEVTGTFADLSPERLRLALAPRESGTHDIPRDRLVRLEVGGRSAARGAGKGAIYGAIGGGVLGLVAAEGACSDGYFTCGTEDYMAVSAIVAGMGAGVGALVGALVRSQTWREVHLEEDER